MREWRLCLHGLGRDRGSGLNGRFGLNGRLGLNRRLRLRGLCRRGPLRRGNRSRGLIGGRQGRKPTLRRDGRRSPRGRHGVLHVAVAITVMTAVTGVTDRGSGSSRHGIPRSNGSGGLGFDGLRGLNGLGGLDGLGSGPRFGGGTLLDLPLQRTRGEPHRGTTLKVTTPQALRDGRGSGLGL